MQIVRNPVEVAQVGDPYIRALLARRFQAIAWDELMPEEVCPFILAEPGDSVADLEREGGIWITTGLFGDIDYGNPDFAPCFEALESHSGHCFEMCFILNDDGYGVTVIVPDRPEIDVQLIRFCREYATPASEPIPG